VYPKVSELAAWSENCKLYSSLLLGAVVLLFLGQPSEFCRHNPLCYFSTVFVVYFIMDSVRNLFDTPSHMVPKGNEKQFLQIKEMHETSRTLLQTHKNFP